MTQTTQSAKILVLLKLSDSDNDFICPDCNAYVARLKGCAVADLTDPDTYALTSVLKAKFYTGTPAKHNGREGGRLGEDEYCRNKFYFYSVDQGYVEVGTIVKVKGPYATAR